MYKVLITTSSFRYGVSGSSEGICSSSIIVPFDTVAEADKATVNAHVNSSDMSKVRVTAVRLN